MARGPDTEARQASVTPRRKPLLDGGSEVLRARRTVMILRWFKRRREARLKVRAAEEAFRRSYSARKLLQGMSGIFHDAGDSVIVQLCYDWGGIPPRRTWWLVSANGSCRELSFEEANAIHPVPMWR